MRIGGVLVAIGSVLVIWAAASGIASAASQETLFLDLAQRLLVLLFGLIAAWSGLTWNPDIRPHLAKFFGVLTVVLGAVGLLFVEQPEPNLSLFHLSAANSLTYLGMGIAFLAACFFRESRFGIGGTTGHQHEPALEMSLLGQQSCPPGPIGIRSQGKKHCGTRGGRLMDTREEENRRMEVAMFRSCHFIPERSAVRIGAVGLLLLALLAMAGCAADPTPTPTPAATPDPMGEATPAPEPTDWLAELQLEKIDPHAIQPQIQASLDMLYERAIAEEGGRVIIWGFSEQHPNAIRAFEEQFPGMRAESTGMGFAMGSRVVTAVQEGAEVSDVLGGAITIIEAIVDRGLHDDTIDWTEYGVPESRLIQGLPGIFEGTLTGTNQFIIQANVGCPGINEEDIPTDPWDFIQPQWQNKLTSTPGFFSGGLSYYALKYGEEAAIELGRALLDEAGLIVTDATRDMAMRCEAPVVFPGTGDLEVPTARGAPIVHRPFDGMGIWPSTTGIVDAARHKYGGMLWQLWNNFDLDWINQNYLDPELGRLSLHRDWPGAEEDPHVRAGLEGVAQGFATELIMDNAAERSRLVTLLREELLQ